jgi:uncharacterized protein YndB with AHSA1/START domain
MADLKFHIDIAVAPNEVFAFFVPQRIPLWYGTEMNARFEVQGGASDFAAGQKVRITGQLKGHAVALTAVITAYDWEKLLEWQFEDSYGVRGSQRWELSPARQGTAFRPEGRRAAAPTSSAKSGVLTPEVGRANDRRSYETGSRANYEGLSGSGFVSTNPETRGTRVTMRDSYRMPGLYGRIVDAVLTRFAVSLRDRSWLDRLDHLAACVIRSPM